MDCQHPHTTCDSCGEGMIAMTAPVRPDRTAQVAAIVTDVLALFNAPCSDPARNRALDRILAGLRSGALPEKPPAIDRAALIEMLVAWKRTDQPDKPLAVIRRWAPFFADTLLRAGREAGA